MIVRCIHLGIFSTNAPRVCYLDLRNEALRNSCPAPEAFVTSAALTLASKVSYSATAGSASWEGRHVEDVEHFVSYVQQVVASRVADAETSFEAELRGMATTGMESEFIENFLKEVPEPIDWEVGEALAECALRTGECALRTGPECEVHWPWNTVRDRRAPRASLPGADLVGFYRNGDTVLLLLGEIKTSSDVETPPNVMYGESGMNWQLHEAARRLDIQHYLIRWLYFRCTTVLHKWLYEKAIERYIKSLGKELLIVGVLIRDTVPNERDLKSRARALAKTHPTPTRIEFIAWYLPVPIQEWPNLLKEEAS